MRAHLRGMYEEHNDRAIFCQKAGHKLRKVMSEINLKVETLGDTTSFDAKISNYGTVHVECSTGTPVAEFELNKSLVPLEAHTLPMFAETMAVLVNYLKWVRGDPHIL